MFAAESIAAALKHLGRAHTAGDIVAHVPDADVVFSGGSADGYTVTATSKSGNAFAIVKDPTTGTSSRTCTQAGTAKGGCPTALTW